MRNLTVFFVTDLHGSDVCFRKCLNGAKIYKADVIIIGGDLTGKMLIPIVNKNGCYKTEYYGTKYILKTNEELEKLKKQIADSGYYEHIAREEDILELRENKEKLNEVFKIKALERLTRWLDLAKEKLRDTKIKVYMTGGNDDVFEVSELIRKSDFVVNPEDEVVRIDDYEMISCGYSNMTPWKCPRDITEEELANRIEGMATKVNNMERAIFNLHVPPYDTSIDLAPKLDETLRPTMDATGMVMTNVGSKAVRQMIEKYQPMLGLHGHIHEAKGCVKLGRTLCINPGSEYGEGILRGCLIKLSDNKVPQYIFTSG